MATIIITDGKSKELTHIELKPDDVITVTFHLMEERFDRLEKTLAISLGIDTIIILTLAILMFSK
jgi:hypothetical protein